MPIGQVNHLAPFFPDEKTMGHRLWIADVRWWLAAMAAFVSMAQVPRPNHGTNHGYDEEHPYLIAAYIAD